MYVFFITMDYISIFITIIFALIAVDIINEIGISYYLMPSIQTFRKRHVPLFGDPKDVLRKWYHLLSQIKGVYSFEKYLEVNFMLSSDEDHRCVKKGNLDSFICWVLYACKLDKIDKDKKEEVVQIRDEVLSLIQYSMEDGYNSKIRHFNSDHEEVKHCYRPILLYGLFSIVETYYYYNYYYKYRFRYKKHGDTTPYYIKIGSSEKPPIVLLHGITSGWFNYYNFITALIQDKDRTIILIDYSNIKTCSINVNVLGPMEYTEHFENILNQYDISKVCLIGHSWGTFTAGWIARLAPNRIDSLILVDPIAINFLLPDSTVEIVYKPPKSKMDWLIYYFVRHALNVSYTIHRHFTWWNETLFLQDIKDLNVLVCIGGKDEILDGPGAREIVNVSVENHKYIYRENMSHNDFINTDESLQELLGKI